MSGMRQKIQYSLALKPMNQGETPISGYHQGTEPFVAKPTSESPASAEQLMEEVCDRENLVREWKRVRSNQGSPGVDGMTIDDAKDHLREHWPSIRSQLLEGTYQPKPVKRVEIPKPDGGVRKLGVPCVVDPLCCTDQQPGAVSPPQRHLREANVLRPAKLEHAVQRGGSNGHLGRLPASGP